MLFGMQMHSGIKTENSHGKPSTKNCTPIMKSCNRLKHSFPVQNP